MCLCNLVKNFDTMEDTYSYSEYKWYYHHELYRAARVLNTISSEGRLSRMMFNYTKTISQIRIICNIVMLLFLVVNLT